MGMFTDVQQAYERKKREYDLEQTKKQMSGEWGSPYYDAIRQVQNTHTQALYEQMQRATVMSSHSSKIKKERIMSNPSFEFRIIKAKNGFLLLRNTKSMEAYSMGECCWVAKNMDELKDMLAVAMVEDAMDQEQET